MILRKFRWTLLLIPHLLTTLTAQNARSYDENDWIPITPSTPSETAKKAQGRVLNLDTPSQNYFPENEFVTKRAQPQQYLQESSFQKGTNVRSKPEPYKYEPVVSLQPPQYTHQNQFVQQQVQPQFVQQVPYVQTLQQVQQVAPAQQQLSQQLVAPPQTHQNYYDSNKQYNSPLNSSYYQSPTIGLNQELLGAIQNQNLNQVQQTTTTTKPKEEKETVQLLYVPLENLKQNPPVTQLPRILKQTEVPRTAKQVTRAQTHRQNQLTNIEDDFISQALAAHRIQQQFQQDEPLVIQTTTTTTPRPRKRKANQPPLAVYMEKQGAADVKDVLEVLKQVKSISVQDNVGPDSPKVFVGPSNIDPEGYAKFPLPYLSTVQGNRIERKVEQLPFFVAPLSYKTPDGYSKIPLPSPHVGSVVISTKEKLHEKNTEVRPAQSAQNQIVQDFDVKQPFAPFTDEPKPNPYLINQNGPQSGLLGFGNGFLGGFPNNAPPNYDIGPPKSYDDYQDNTKDVGGENYDETPSKDFPNYDLRLKENANQYYETTPSYKPREPTNVRGNYQIPDYQSGEREVPNQNPKELIRDYDIPSLPVESKTTFTPTYQIEQKPQISQFQKSDDSSYLTPKTPADVYNLNEEVIRQTTTTTTTEPVSVIPQNQFRVQNSQPEYNSRGVTRQDPLRQVIDQYEIEQINSQLDEEKNENVEPVRSTTPAVVSTQKYNEYSAPTPGRGRSRGRHRGRTTTTSTTPNNLEENYTVLEEFNIQPKTSTVKYTTEVETIPAKVYKLEHEPSPVYVQNQAPLRQQVLNQGTLDQQILQGDVPSRSTPEYKQRLSPQPNGGFNQQISPSRPVNDFAQQTLPQGPSRPDFTQQTLLNNVPSRTSTDFTQQQQALPKVPYRASTDYTQQSLPSVPSRTDFNQQIFQVNTPSRPSSVYNQQILPVNSPSQTRDLIQDFIDDGTKPETERPSSDIQNPPLTQLVTTRDEDEEQAAPANPYLPGLINNLQDQAVRPLLIPNLLVPTTEKITTDPPRPTTEEIRFTTTEAPRVETTTARGRSRGRQRAQSRNYSSTSAPRRNASRRRPTYTRPTTERTYSTTTEASYEPTKRVSSQRQRFRTRGRTAQKEQATERILQTTESVFKQPPLEGGFQASSGDPQSYMQFDHVIDNQQVITIKPQNREEVPLKEYHQVYSLSPQSPSTERVFEEITTTQKPVIDFKISHPVTDRIQEPVIITTPRDDSRFVRINSNIQSGGVIYNNKNDEDGARPRTRVRSRTRGRLSTTTPRVVATARTTTPKPQVEEEDDEFYGFIRKPNFNNPAAVVQTTTQQSLPLYSSSYQEPQRTIIQLEEDGAGQNYETGSTPTPVQFVGQIRPKYTTEAQEYSTEAPKVRPRARIRVPNRKVTNHQQSYNEVKPQKLDDQVTRRSSVVRTRTRGKSHYKTPENLKTKNNDDDDVEGGNYPGNYQKSRELTTEKPSAFQITVDPQEEEDEDQVPHSSLYSPQIIRNTDTQWVEASVLPEANDLKIDDKLFVTSFEELTTLQNEEEAKTEKNEEITTTEAAETTTLKRRKVGRRKGVWRLVKHKPVDSFETAESQNYFSVLNTFDNIEKKKETATTTTTTTTTTSAPSTTPKMRQPTTTTTESSIFETIYSMLGFASKASQIPSTKPNRTKVVVHREEITTTTASPTFPEEYTEGTTTEEIKQTEDNRKDETTIIPETTTVLPITSVKNYDVEPWEMHAIKTSTSTEVSHETEICYKGKCIKSKDDETRL